MLVYVGACAAEAVSNRVLGTLEIGQIPKMTVHKKLIIEYKEIQPNVMILVLLQ